MHPLDARIGHRFARVTAVAEPGRLRFFHQAIGEENPAMTGAGGGGRKVALPPTYLFCLEMLDADNPVAFVDEIGVPISSVLHAEQEFFYHALVHVGDRLQFDAHLADVVHKKNGQLTFLIQKIEVRNHAGTHVADLSRTLAIQNRASSAKAASQPLGGAN